MAEALSVEQALLGLLLSGPQHIDASVDLETSELYLDSHRRLLTVIRQMHAKGEEVNLVTFAAELSRCNLTEALGGLAYVSSLTDAAHLGLQDVRQYVRRVKQAALSRKVKALCHVAVGRIDAGDDPDEVLHALQGTAVEAQAASIRVAPTHISEHVLPTWEAMQEEMSRQGSTLGIPTGLSSLDYVLTGWRPGELTYVGALPGRGKTSFLLQAMHHAALNGFGVGCISLEMRAQQLMRRLATIRSGLPAYKIRDPREMNVTERNYAKQALFDLAEAPIWINDQSGLRPGAITSLARQMHAKGAKVIFVDFVQIIQEDGQDRREAINRVSAALRDASKALQIPFVVASQLTRRTNDVENPPTLRDLKESGNLEQDAHNVLLFHRPQREGKWTGEDLLIVAKQREGDTGVLHVTYDERALIFRNRETSNHSTPQEKTL